MWLLKNIFVYSMCVEVELGPENFSFASFCLGLFYFLLDVVHDQNWKYFQQ